MSIFGRRHSRLTGRDVGSIIWKEVADAAARLALAVTSVDNGRVVLQTDDSSHWVLVDYAGPTYIELTAIGVAAVTSVFGVQGDVVEADANFTNDDVGLGNVEDTKVNLTAVVDPVAGDDTSGGWSTGSTWINTATDTAFICVDAAVATWQEIGAGGGSGTWGFITGDITSQADLQAELDAKTDTGHAHAAADVTSGTFADALVASSNVTQHEGDITHNSLGGVDADEHLDWTVDQGATNIHSGNYASGTGGATDTVTGSLGITNTGDDTNAVLTPTYGATADTIAEGDDTRIVNSAVHATGDGSDHADVATNTVHAASDGTDHANVVTNDAHVAGDGSDHADVATNTSDIAALGTAAAEDIGTTNGTIPVHTADGELTLDDGAGNTSFLEAFGVYPGTTSDDPFDFGGSVQTTPRLTYFSGSRSNADATDAGNVIIRGGVADGTNSTGGDIELYGGIGTADDGDLRIGGYDNAGTDEPLRGDVRMIKGFSIKEDTASPMTTVAGRGVLWPRSSDGAIIWTDSSDVDHDLTTSGSGTMAIEDEGTPVSGGPHDTMNFIGGGVTAADDGGGVVTVTIAPGAAPIDTVFSRTGTVVAEASDYPASLIDNDSADAPGAFVDDALDALDALADQGIADAATADGKAVAAQSDATSAKTITDRITVTQAVNLDTIESDTATNNAKVTYDDAATVSANAGKLANVATTITAVGAALVEDTTVIDQRATLGLGSAALLDEGVLIGDLVELENVGGNPGMPQVDGSQLENIASAIEVVDESTSLTIGLTKLTFTGAGVEATEPGAEGEILVDIDTGGAGAIDIVGNPDSVSAADLLTFDTTAFTVTDQGGDDALVDAAFGTGAGQIAAGDHTHDTLANVSENVILGRDTAGSGNSEELTGAEARGVIGVSIGNILSGSVAEFQGKITDGPVITAQAAEISGLTAKGTPVTGDFLLIEDSAAGDAKKSITMGDIDHDALTNFASNEHFTEASIDHANLAGGAGVGSNTHAQIDTHIADGDIHSTLGVGNTAGKTGYETTDYYYHDTEAETYQRYTGSVWEDVGVEVDDATLEVTTDLHVKDGGIDLDQMAPTGTGLQVLRANTGNTALEFADMTGAVASVFGRTDAVTAVSGDYDLSEIGAGLKANLDTILTDANVVSSLPDEFAAGEVIVTEKGVPVGNDKLLIEDSAASGAKKYITIDNIQHGHLASLGVDDHTQYPLGAGTRAQDALYLTERGNRVNTPGATKAELWVSDDATQKLYFTDDAGTDIDLTDTGGSGGDVSSDGTTSVAGEIPTYTDTGQKEIGRSTVLVNHAAVAGTTTLNQYAAIAGGRIQNDGTIEATAAGSIALGALSDLGGTAKLSSSGQGSVAFGQGTAIDGTVTITSSGDGALAQGYCLQSVPGASAVTASGDGSFAIAKTGNGETCEVSGNNSAQFGVGTNVEDVSIQVGDIGSGGMRLIGDGAVSASPQNGDMYCDGTDVFVRTGGAWKNMSNIT